MGRSIDIFGSIHYDRSLPIAQGGEMAEVLLFHHAQGQTAGFHAFADELRAAGHTVHAPDLFDGRTFATIDEGMAYAQELGFPDEILYPGDQHYFADSFFPSYDRDATALLTRRVLDFHGAQGFAGEASQVKETAG